MSAKVDREFARVLRQSAPTPIWARIVGTAIGLGILGLIVSLVAWPIWAIWTAILT